MPGHERYTENSDLMSLTKLPLYFDSPTTHTTRLADHFSGIGKRTIDSVKSVLFGE